MGEGMSELRFLRAGDAAVAIELGNKIDPDLNEDVCALDQAILEAPFDGYIEAIPTYRSLLVFYEPAKASFESIRAHVRALFKKLDASTISLPARSHEVPTVYDGADLDDVARLAGVTKKNVIRLHSGKEYRVYVVGFTPGFAYMGMTDEKLALGRRSSPRTRVPAGAVAIAMGQTGIYPQSTPGGWHLLGRAEHRSMFDIASDPPSRFLPGDRVRFVPVKRLPSYEPASAPNPQVPRSSPSLTVEDGGLFTTVQDLGRVGYQRYGVPVAGAVDVPALRAANGLVGNEPGAAALECTVSGPRLRCLRTTIASVTGADLGAVVERRDLGRWRVPPRSSFRLRPGNVLTFEGRRSGARAYVAFAGGIDVPLVLGSRSTYAIAEMGGFEGRALQAGDGLAVREAKEIAVGRVSSVKGLPETSEGDVTLRIVWGPQDDYFTDEGRATLVTSVYSVGPASDRMGYRLEGPPLEHEDAQEIISDGMMLGAVQVPPSGLPIVMLADRATTGGYPKIATVVGEDVAKLGQLLPGERVRFRAVEL